MKRKRGVGVKRTLLFKLVALGSVGNISINIVAYIPDIVELLSFSEAPPEAYSWCICGPVSPTSLGLPSSDIAPSSLLPTCCPS